MLDTRSALPEQTIAAQPPIQAAEAWAALLAPAAEAREAPPEPAVPVQPEQAPLLPDLNQHLRLKK